MISRFKPHKERLEVLDKEFDDIFPRIVNCIRESLEQNKAQCSITINILFDVADQFYSRVCNKLREEFTDINIERPIKDIKPYWDDTKNLCHDTNSPLNSTGDLSSSASLSFNGTIKKCSYRYDITIKKIELRYK